MTKSTLEENKTFKVTEQKNKLDSSLKELIQDVMKSHKDIREANSLYLADLKDAQRK
jgi:hypothetical protein